MADEPKFEWGEFRKRIEYEDAQLATRVNVFLVFNALAAATFSLATNSGTRLMTSAVVVIANLLLCLLTVQTAWLVRCLTTEYMRNANDPIDARVRRHLRWAPRLFRSNFILGIWLPLVILVAWVIGLVLTITSGSGT